MFQASPTGFLDNQLLQIAETIVDHYVTQILLDDNFYGQDCYLEKSILKKANPSGYWYVNLNCFQILPYICEINIDTPVIPNPSNSKNTLKQIQTLSIQVD